MIYIHKNKVSLKVKILKVVAKILGMNKGLKKKLETNNFSNGWVAKPPDFLYKEFDIKDQIINDRNVFTIASKKKKSNKVILYLHGGAYVNNFIKQHWDLAAVLMRQTDATFVLPDYPLAPNYNYLDTIAMVYNVYLDILKNKKEQEIIFMGDSAGAGLGLALTQKLKMDGLKQPDQIVLLSPWLDVTMQNKDALIIEKQDIILNINSLQMAGKLYAGDEPLSNSLISPINGSLTGIGKISVFIGTHDVLYPDCLKLKKMLEAQNIPMDFYEYPKMFHVWMAMIGLKESKNAIKQIAAIINA